MTLPADHRDAPLLQRLAEAVYAACGGKAAFVEGVPALFRQSFDEVIDAPRTGRFTIEQTEKTEKTYLGTKIEILLRNFLGLPKGQKLDLLVDGAEVDIKNTMGRNWMIPKESLGHPALLLRADETAARCDIGLIAVKEQYLTPGKNQDSKRSVSAAGMGNVHWLIADHPYPPNFWTVLPAAQREEILRAGAGSARVAKLFELLQRRPVSRSQIQALAQQHDYKKRIRRNGGARDILAPMGIAVLWGQNDKALIAELGLGAVGNDQFVSITPNSEAEAALLRRAGHID